MNHPRSGFAAPPQGGTAGGPAKPDPRRLLDPERLLRTAIGLTFIAASAALWWPAGAQAATRIKELASVQRVLPNGHLVIAGEKQIGVNANVDVLRFSGQIDPRAILPGNSVASTSIANVRIEQRGRGQQAEAQSMGWLARFFLSLWPV